MSKIRDSLPRALLSVLLILGMILSLPFPVLAEKAVMGDILVQCDSAGAVADHAAVTGVNLPVVFDDNPDYYPISMEAGLFAGGTSMKELTGLAPDESGELEISLGAVTNYDYDTVYEIKYRGHYGIVGEGTEIIEGWQSAGLYFKVELGASEDDVSLNTFAAGTKIRFAGYNWIVLNPASGYLLLQNLGAQRAFDTSNYNSFDPAIATNIGHYLNTVFYNSLPAAARNRIQVHTWGTGTVDWFGQGDENTSSVNAKIGLISYKEWKNNYRVIVGYPPAGSAFWTRTITPEPTLAWTVTNIGSGFGGESKNGAVAYARPALYLSSEQPISPITYELDGGTNSTANPGGYIRGTSFSFDSPVKDGYKFMGWFDNDESQGSAVTGITDTDSGAKTLYASWRGIGPATISQIMGDFDLYHPEDVETTITWNDATTVSAVTAGETPLAYEDDYTVTYMDGDTAILTIKKEYLAAQAVGSLPLTIEFDEGDPAILTIDISDTTPVNPTIESITAVDDIEVAYGSSEEEAITALAATTTIIDSSSAGHEVTLEWCLPDYDGNTAGEYEAVGTFALPAGVEQTDPETELKVTATVTVLEPQSAAVSPTVAVFDLADPGDVSTTITWHDAREVINVGQGGDSLAEDDGYELDGDILSIKASYIEALPIAAGDIVEFQISFDLGDSAEFTVEITDGHIPSADVSLSELTVGGSTVDGFAADEYEYDVELPFGTEPLSRAATVEATPHDPKAKADITQAAELPGSATAEVTAEDGTKQTYTINFTLAEPEKSSEARLSALTAIGISLSPEFSPNQTEYSDRVSHSRSSTTITATPLDSKATVEINGVEGNCREIDLTVGSSTISILVTAEDCTTQETYTLTITRDQESSDDNDSSDSGTQTESDKPDSSPEDENYISLNKETTTTPEGQTVETFTITGTTGAEIAAAKAQGETAVQFRIESSPTARAEITIPASVLDSAAGLNVSIVTPRATLELPAALVEALVQAGRDLSLTVTRGGEIDTPQDTSVLGTPTTINADLQGTTQVTIPLNGITFPADPEAREAFLASLAVFALHSDGEEEIIQAEINYDEAGNPVSISFPADKFSTFAVIKLEKKTVLLTISRQTARINGINSSLDAAPFLDHAAGRAMAPLRFIGEALGAKVEWLPAYNQVKITEGGKEIILTLYLKAAFINGEKITLDCAPVIAPPGRIFLPMRFISETLGAEVAYDAAAGQIRINK